MFEPSDPATAAAVTLAEVRALGDQLTDLMLRLDADSVPLADVPAVWQEFESIRRFGATGTTMLARKVDQSGVWRRAGCKSVDEYLARKAGCSLGDARRQRRASEQLPNLADTSDALRRGQLSPDQAEAISDAATANPDAEQKLLDDAKRKSLRDLQEECARERARGDRDPDATRKRIHRERRFNLFGKPDGSSGVAGNGPVDDAAVLQAALQPIIDHLSRLHRDTPDQDERQAYTWDALIELARGALHGTTPPATSCGTSTETAGGTSTEAASTSSGTDTTGDARRPKRTRPDYLAILRIDLAALIRGWVEGDEVCEIPGLGPVPVTRMRELLPESSIRLVITKGTDVANVTYLGRGPNAAQQIALLWSQPLCQDIACGNTWLQNDHRNGFAEVRCTELPNIDRLCPHHHQLKTTKGWALVTGIGRRAFVPPTDPRHPRHGGGAGGAASGREPPDSVRDDEPQPGSDHAARGELFPDTS